MGLFERYSSENCLKRTAHHSSLSSWDEPATSKIFKYLECAKLSKKPKFSEVEKLRTLYQKMLQDDKFDYEVFASVFVERSDFQLTSIVSILPILEEFDTSINTIEGIAEGLDTTKASRPDEIPPIVFKKCARTFSNSLTQFFYSIHQTGVFPNMLKVSTVSPTFKKDYKYDVENYRQLSHPTTASKSLERRIYVDPYKHFEPTLISPQFGFRKRLSCNFQLLVPSRLFINLWRKISKSKRYKQTTRKLSTELVDHGLLL